jgi:hypothetical protein
VPYADVLRALKALLAKGRATPREREALLARETPGLADEERAALLDVPEERLAVYADLVRENQATVLRFAARSTLSAIVRFGGATEAEVAQATLLETPRRTGRMRELNARLLDHLAGPGRPWVERCPALLDLARMDQAQTEAFYAADDPGALAPSAFETLLSERTVDDVLRLECRAPAASRSLVLRHDVVSWRDRWSATGEWPDPPPPVEGGLEVLCVRDPTTLQPVCRPVDPALLPLLRPEVPGGGPWRPVERLAEAWVAALGEDASDEQAAARFFESLLAWVRAGLLSVRGPS